ncbi:hypothetical protein [Microbacterium mangrovi]|uniref:hypothetical protein n=1 Tax=Microbacterium mangrovi TaxID=1348253 RepID=UPI0012E019F2|nr:hypothetical protein [Microbacterium mangrovi]
MRATAQPKPGGRVQPVGSAEDHVAKLEEMKAIGVDHFAGYLERGPGIAASQADGWRDDERMAGDPAASRPPEGQTAAIRAVASERPTPRRAAAGSRARG